MTNTAAKKIVLAGLFLALGLLLPFLTMQIPSLGQALLPMHIPVLMAGFALGGPWGLLIGLVTPVLRSVLFGMPPMFPHAAAMSFELAAYGLFTGLLYKALPRKNWSVYVALVIAMIVGRVVWGAASLLIYGLQGNPFTGQMFIAGAVLNAVPGIVLQLVLIPLLVFALQRARLMAND
ncbi:MAG: ECF transporter S component [Firmicutes bacterium]|nr:ECF transporter S component [Bacillota bacterium]HOB35431.1 ECF transporter S component [Bacillota bacterium]HPZ91202.1 ECF transporter S component [Bacillota bacterium]HQE02276.1 ECF transporter S component [Bacillota bacterium]